MSKGIFDDAFKSIVKRLSGKIRQAPQLCRFVKPDDEYQDIPEGYHLYRWTNKAGKVLSIFHDADGKPMIVSSGMSVICHNPDFQNVYPRNTYGYIVPRSICHKCENYVSVRNSRRGYSLCKLCVTPNPEKAAAEEILGIFAKATKMADEMINGGAK